MKDFPEFIFTVAAVYDYRNTQTAVIDRRYKS